MKNLADKIKSVFCIRVPLGAVNSSEDVERIVEPIVNALKHESEEYIEGIKDYLVGLNEKI